ncbi:MAG TPA: response regulator transcription factor [Planctomycetota bacterium]|jgi:DNA-binding NarL/FixJ family response regulator|nr:response regulator transcription factor [Planctomycetota bacterium]
MSSGPGSLPKGSRKKKVLLVEDHPIVRQGLAEVINRTRELAVCGEASTVKEALRVIPELKPELAIVDLSLGEESGLAFIKDLQVRHPELPVLVLSMHEESFYAERVLRAGAKGYIMKREPVGELRSAALRVLAGEIYLSPRMSQRLLHTLAKGGKAATRSPEHRLSDRELDVFKLIGRGRGASEVAKQLHLSVKTIETYQVRLKEKLGLGSAEELFQYALNWVRSQEPE